MYCMSASYSRNKKTISNGCIVVLHLQNEKGKTMVDRTALKNYFMYVHNVHHIVHVHIQMYS